MRLSEEKNSEATWEATPSRVIIHRPPMPTAREPLDLVVQSFEKKNLEVRNCCPKSKTLKTPRIVKRPQVRRRTRPTLLLREPLSRSLFHSLTLHYPQPHPTAKNPIPETPPDTDPPHPGVHMVSGIRLPVPLSLRLNGRRGQR